jgi:hypothetical protein
MNTGLRPGFSISQRPAARCRGIHRTRCAYCRRVRTSRARFVSVTRSRRVVSAALALSKVERRVADGGAPQAAVELGLFVAGRGITRSPGARRQRNVDRLSRTGGGPDWPTDAHRSPGVEGRLSVYGWSCVDGTAVAAGGARDKAVLRIVSRRAASMRIVRNREAPKFQMGERQLWEAGRGQWT